MTPYDEVRYPGHPYPQTHPSRLAAIARLFGLTPAPPERCRVLEIACGDAANLIPLAWASPGSEFVGFDLAQTPIEAGRQLAARLRLTNLSLQAMDLRDFPADSGRFDYIIAHGLYSWIPDPLRGELLALVARHLAPHGVAFISYNTYPGCYIRRMVWEMLRFHVEHLTDPAQRAAEAQALVRLLADGQSHPNDYGTLLRAEASRVLERDPDYLLHDDLADINEPAYFHEFLERAESHGLQYLGEAELGAMSTAGIKPHVRAVLEPLDPLLREQYLDFVRGRQFRQTLLCASGLTVDRMPRAERLDGLLLGASVKAQILAQDSQDEQSLKALMEVLQEQHPLRLGVTEALALTEGRLGGLPTGTRPGYLRDLALLAVRAGAAEVYANAPALTRDPGERPVASELARLQNEHGATVTNLCHEPVKLDTDIARSLLALLDGTRDRTQLMNALGERLDDGPDRAQSLELHLRNLARLALLVSPVQAHCSSSSSS
jgi:SAM-dependent methyltransferase